jgi:hypothetical protein
MISSCSFYDEEQALQSQIVAMKKYFHLQAPPDLQVAPRARVSRFSSK